MLRPGLLALAMCACNQAFGVNDTTLLDAPPVDAPFQCPMTGAPSFSGLLHQVTTQPCTAYSQSTSANLAVASCVQVPHGPFQVSQGPIDGQLAPANLVLKANTMVVLAATLSSDGDELWVQQLNTTQPTFSYEIYQAEPDGSWQWEFQLQVPVQGQLIPPTAPTRRGDHKRRFLYAFNPGSPPGLEVDEYEEQAPGTWLKIDSYSPAQLGITDTSMGLTLSSDGLRLVMAAQDGVLYSSRAAVTERFGAATALVAPVVQHPYLTDDCARLYTDEISSLFYSQQL